MSNEGWTSNNPINWDDVPDAAPGKAPDALYQAKVVEAKAMKTSGGHQGIKLVVELQAPYGGGELGYISRKVYDTLVNTPDARFRIKQCANACGAALPATDSFEALEVLAESLVGAEPIVKTQQRFNKDKTDKFVNVAVYATQAMADDLAKGGSGASSAEAARPAPRRKR